MRESRRRVLLTATAATLSVGAGCVGLLDGDDDGTDDESDDESGDESEPKIPPGDWPSFQRSPRNDGYTPASAPTEEPTERWSTTLSGALEEQVAVVDGVVYAATDDGTVHALEAASGDEVWTESLEAGRSQCPCVVDGLVVVGTLEGDLVALDASEGNREWTTELAGPVAGPTAADGTVYVGTSEEPTAYAVDAADGDELWSADLAVDAVDYPAVTEDGVYVGAEHVRDGRLYAFEPADGDERWVHEGTRMQSPTAVEDDIVSPSLSVDVLSPGGSVRGGFGFRGHVLWSPAATTDAIVASSTGGRVAAVDRTDYGRDWNVEVGRRPLPAPAVTDERVYLTATVDGPELLALDVDTGDRQWSRSLNGATATGPAIADGAIFVGNDQGRLVALE